MLEDIKQQVAEVISYSQNIDINALGGIDSLIDQWFQNKKYFYRAMRNQYILKSDEPVSFEMDQDARRKQLMKFITRIEEHYGNRRLAAFLDENFLDFYDNILKSDYYLIREDKTIQAGTKIIKAFKYFVPNKDELHTIQDEASMLIQENKITGIFCVSIHPLDFLSSSENTYNWRSCHALDGDYRAGNLDYMIDDSTVICYLEGAESAKLPNFPASVPWNSKKWRMLLNFNSGNNKELVFAGRQYPFESQTALEVIRNKILPLLMGKSSIYISNWHNDILGSNFYYEYEEPDEIFEHWHYLPKFRAFIPNGIPIIDSQLIKVNKRHYHYNDLLYSTIYEKPYYAWTPECYANIELHIGGDLKCVCCGEKVPYGSDGMVCNDCYEKYVGDIVYCNCCERHIYPNQVCIMLYNGDKVCLDCADNVMECEECGLTFYKSSLRESRKLNKQYVCPNCRTNEIKKIKEIDWDKIFGN